MRRLVLVLLLASCSSPDASTEDECGPQKPCPGGFECHPVDRRCIQSAGPADAAPAAIDAGADAAGAPDAGPTVYGCGAFSTPSGWTTTAGFRSTVVAAGAPLAEPVALTFAGGPFGGALYVVDQGADALYRVDPATGEVRPFVAREAWPRVPALLTTVVWDAGGAFDGNLYVGDQGGDGDADSVIFRVDGEGRATVFTAAPGPGLDDIYGLVFSPGGDYAPGLYVSGDTDGGGGGWGRFDAAGAGAPFATFAGVEGLAVDTLGRFGGGLFASMPAGGGYSGDDTISRITPAGEKGAALVTARPGIHAVTFAPEGPFGADAYAASWSSQKVLRIAPGGAVSDLATGLSLTNYDGNILAFSPDGRVLHVADRQNHRLVCIEPE
jgi:hypothetical protein